MRALVASIVLLAGAGCASVTAQRGASDPDGNLRYSPYDGLVVSAIDTSSVTSNFAGAEALLDFQNVDLDYRVRYRVRQPVLLIEAGRYRLVAIHIAGFIVPLDRSPVFEVKPHRATILPTIRLETRGANELSVAMAPSQLPVVPSNKWSYVLGWKGEARTWSAARQTFWSSGSRSRYDPPRTDVGDGGNRGPAPRRTPR